MTKLRREKQSRKRALLDAAKIVCVLCRLHPKTTGFDGCGFWIHTGAKGFAFEEACMATNIYRLMASEGLLAWRTEKPQGKP